MEIQVSRFREVLGLLKPVVPRNPTLKVLVNVRLKDGQVMATDLDTMVVIPVPEADISCLIPYKDTMEMLKYVQGGETLHIKPLKAKVEFKWSEGKSTFSADDIKDFPEIPAMEPTAEAELNSDALIPAMQSILTYTATETDRPVLNGITLDLGSPVQVAAGDGFRMAYQVLPFSFPQNITVIIPSSSVPVLFHIWDKTPRNPPPSDALVPVLMAKRQVKLSLDGKRGLKFDFLPAATVIVKRVEGEPPAWLKLIPKDEPVLQSQFMASDLTLAVRRAVQVAKGGSNVIRMEFEDSTLKVSAKSDDQKVESSIKTYGTKGAPNRLGLNSKYLLEYLSGKEGIVSFAWTGGSAPAIFQNQKSPRVVIMPMQVQW